MSESQAANAGAPAAAETAAEKGSFPKWAIVLLVIFAIPVGLPLAVSLAAAVLSIALGAASALLAFFISGAAMIVSGGAMTLAMPFVAFTSVGSAVLIGGAGLFSVGLGIVFMFAVAALARLAASGFRRAAKRLRGGAHGK